MYTHTHTSISTHTHTVPGSALTAGIDGYFSRSRRRECRIHSLINHYGEIKRTSYVISGLVKAAHWNVWVLKAMPFPLKCINCPGFHTHINTGPWTWPRQSFIDEYPSKTDGVVTLVRVELYWQLSNNREWKACWRRLQYVLNKHHLNVLVCSHTWI